MIEKHAGWNLHPISERDLEEESRIRAEKRQAGWLLLLASFAVCPTFWTTAITLGSASTALWLFAAGPLFVLLTAGLYVRKAKIKDEFGHARLSALLDEHRPFADGWLVELAIYQGAALTGKDQGILWTEDGRLIFSGFRTSFALGSEAIQGKPKKRWRIDGLRSALTVELTNAAPQPVSLGFTPVHSNYPFKDPSVGGLSDAIQEWSAQKLPEQRLPAETQWPPLSLGPNVPSASLLFHRAFMGTLFWFLAVVTSLSVIVLAPEVSPGVLFLFICFAAFCPEVWLPRRRWRAYRDRQKLDGQQRSLP